MQPPGGSLRFSATRPESLVPDRLRLLSFDRRWLGAVIGAWSLASLFTAAPYAQASLSTLIPFEIPSPSGRFGMALYLIVAYGFLSVIANVVTMAAGVAMYLGRGWGKPVAMLGIAISAVTYLILAAEPFELGGVLWQSDLQAAGGIVGVALLALLVMLSPSPSPRPAPGSGPAGISSWAWSRPGRTVVSLIQPGAKGLGLTLAAWSVAMLVGAVPSAYDGWSLLSGLPVSLPPASWQPLYGVVWAWLWAAAAVLQLGGGSGMLSGARRARAAARAGAVVGMLAAVAEVPFDLHATGGIQFGWVVLGLPLGHLLIEAGILYLLGTVIAPKASPSSA